MAAVVGVAGLRVAADRALEVAAVEVVMGDAAAVALELGAPLDAVADRVVAPEDVVLDRLVGDRQPDLRRRA